MNSVTGRLKMSVYIGDVYKITQMNELYIWYKNKSKLQS